MTPPTAQDTGQTGRELRPGIYGFDDLAEGDWLRTAEVEVTAGHIDAFAAVSGDHFEIHMDDAAARSHGFPGRVAHGLLVLSMTDGLKNQAPAQLRTIASLGWDWSFAMPVFIGDRIRVTVTVREKRPVKNPERGILGLDFTVDIHDGRQVQAGRNLLMVYR